MATPIPPNQASPPKEDPKKEEARREEQAKLALEQELADFDAHLYYEQLASWIEMPIPKQYKRALHISLFKIKEVPWQPLPISRVDERSLNMISQSTRKVLDLLRRVDQKGLECPYIHQLNKHVIEQAIAKCGDLQEASKRYLNARGVSARFDQFFHKSHLLYALKDLDAFKKRLEAIFVMCRHQEFAHELMTLRRDVTFRTGNVLKDEADVVQLVPQSEKKQPAVVRQPQIVKNRK